MEIASSMALFRPLFYPASDAVLAQRAHRKERFHRSGVRLRRRSEQISTTTDSMHPFAAEPAIKHDVDVLSSSVRSIPGHLLDYKRHLSYEDILARIHIAIINRPWRVKLGELIRWDCAN